MKRTIGTILASIALAVPAIMAAPAAHAAETYVRTETNILAFHRQRAETFMFNVSAHHSSTGNALHGYARVYVNGIARDTDPLYRGNASFSIPRSWLPDNRWASVKVRILPWDPSLRDMIVTRSVIDRPLGAAEALKIAKYQVGDRYISGGTGPDAFDCSGLIQYSYRHATGRSLPHSSTAIRDLGRRISRADARPGDLVWVPGHIAFYAGNGRVVEAANPRVDVVYRTMWQSSPVFIRL